MTEYDVPVRKQTPPRGQKENTMTKRTAELLNWIVKNSMTGDNYSTYTKTDKKNVILETVIYDAASKLIDEIERDEQYDLTNQTGYAQSQRILMRIN